MEIVLLGTGAARPTLRRNATSLALLRESEVLLFDCGEATQIQFQKARLKPGKVTRIFISHFHGDHFYGLIGLLTSLQLANREKELHVYGPAGLTPYLAFMQELSQFRFQFELVAHEVETGSEVTTWDFADYSVTARPLSHRLLTYGFLLAEHARPGKFDPEAARHLGIPVGPERRQLQMGMNVALADGRTINPWQVIGAEQPGGKVAICVDTAPCENAVQLAKETDVLIHEATYDENRADLARLTGHSTIADAARIARKAGAKRLIATHISARYERKDEELLLRQARQFFANTTIGEDLMRLEV